MCRPPDLEIPFRKIWWNRVLCKDIYIRMFMCTLWIEGDRRERIGKKENLKCPLIKGRLSKLWNIHL